MSITENIRHFLSQIPENVTLVAVSKTKPIEDLKEAYEAGQRIFGENKIQEMTDKQAQLPEDIEWHMIGHVQTNKVKYMAPYVSLIHSVDRMKLLKEVQKQAASNNRTIDVLIQVKIAEEDSKFGMAPNDAEDLLSSNVIDDFPNVRIVGLMGMATFTDDEEQLKREFSIVEALYTRFRESVPLKELSMGMSGDYKLAIENGSTMIRVGSAIFGARNYNN